MNCYQLYPGYSAKNYGNLLLKPSKHTLFFVSYIMITYDSHVRPFAHLFERVKIPHQRFTQAEQWANQMIAAKEQETHWKKDPYQAKKRLMTGVLGEIAIEILTDSSFIDWSISANSAKYHQPDLSKLGLNAGIKTVEHGKFPIIFKKNNYPQLINIFRYVDQTCFICGLASVEVLNTYQSDELILSPKLRARGTKTGFYGFEYLDRYQSITEH